MRPVAPLAQPPAPATFDGGAGVLAGLRPLLTSSYGMAYAPCPPAGEIANLDGGGDGGGNAGPVGGIISLVLTSFPASPVTSFRLRSLAVMSLVRPAPGRRLAAAAAAGAARSGGDGGTGDGGGGGGLGPRRPRRRSRVELDAVPSEAERRRIVRNRAAAGRSNAARRAARLAARDAAVAVAGGGGAAAAPPPAGGGVPAARGVPPRPLLPRPMVPWP